MFLSFAFLGWMFSLGGLPETMICANYIQINELFSSIFQLHSAVDSDHVPVLTSSLKEFLPARGVLVLASLGMFLNHAKN
jgi:hypothetical protein